MRKSVPNSQIRALAMAMAGGIVAAVAAMFIPVAILEGITGSTGLSELVPAARAPLGDTARALIAFGAGAITLAVLAYLLLRQDSTPVVRTAPSVPASDWAADDDDDTPSFKDRLARIKLPSLAMPKMPWQKDEDDITDLADLPKLRNGDVHPDAPPRRPLVASQDLPVLDLVEVAIPVADQPEVDGVKPLAEAEIEPADTETPVVAPAPGVTAEDAQPTLAEMVAQLEAAVAERQNQLAELEIVAAQLAAGNSQPTVTPVLAEPEAVEVISASDIAIDPPRTERPPLEAVPASPAKEEEMDAALAAALATLQRMNGTGR